MVVLVNTIYANIGDSVVSFRRVVSFIKMFRAKNTGSYKKKILYVGTGYLRIEKTTFCSQDSQMFSLR